MKRVLLCLIALYAAPLAAQAPSFVGTWQLTYPRGKMIENGEETIIWGTGILTFGSQGDSLIGTLVGDPTPDVPPRPPARLAAAATKGEATFLSRTQATMNQNGSERTVIMVSTWKLTVRGDSLVGTVARELEGYDTGGAPPPAEPVKGSRKKG
jgi:hypothetical protein